MSANCKLLSAPVLTFGSQERPDWLLPPENPLFYGFINDCVENLVCDNFGRDKWHAFKHKAGLGEVHYGDFFRSHQYPQQLTYSLIGAVSEVLGITGQQSLDMVGEYYVGPYLHKHSYLDLLRSQSV